ncbi:hypothetical protein O0L34_g4365 [Tuta absoluta]|nr:hypothetical protein O0L34_g4365 [Tuta absoluta]
MYQKPQPQPQVSDKKNQKPQPQGPQGAKPAAKSLVRPMGYVPDPIAYPDLVPEFDEENSRFVIRLADGDCELPFEIRHTEPVKTITLHAVNIPETARGQDLGKKLAKVAFDFAVMNKMDVVIKCAFLAHYYTDHRRNYRNKLRVTGRYAQPPMEMDEHF